MPKGFSSYRATCPKCGREGQNGGMQAHIKHCGRKLDAEWFWPRVDRGAPDACWPWTGSISSWGYGTINFKGKSMGAHKLAWVLTNGPVPDGLCVLHKCDNRACCNPGHFFLGTKKDNAADAVAKDRHARGERTKKNKLTEDQVREIRSRYVRENRRGGNGIRLAKEYGVLPGAIHAVVARRSWRHVK